MRAALAWSLTVALAVHVVAHVALSILLAQKEPRWRGLVAFVLPPLAFWWGLESGRRRLAFVWLGALALYAFGVAAA